MRELIGKGVGTWTSSKDDEFSNFVFGSGSRFDNFRENTIEAMGRRIFPSRGNSNNGEIPTRDEDMISDRNLGLEGDVVSRLRKPSSQQQLQQQQDLKKPPYLLYGGIGVAIIVAAMYIFTRK